MVYNRTLKIYRSVDNRIDLQLRNSDQKAINATGSYIVFNLVSRENSDLVIQKDCSIDDLAVGRVYVTLTETELQGLEKGYYQYSFHKETRENIDSVEYKVLTKMPLYLDSQYGAIGQLYIEGDLEGNPYDTKVIDTFRKITNFDVPRELDTNTQPLQSPRPNFSQNYNTTGYEEYFISSTIDAQPNVTRPQSLHTFQFFYQGYTGEVILEGTLGKGGDPIEGSWTPIQTFNITSSNVNEYYNVTGKYNWFRIKHTPDENNTGTVDKVLYR